MKTSAIVWAFVIAIVVIGGWYWWSAHSSMQPAPGAPSDQASASNSPAQSATNQQNAGTPQQPATGDGTGPAQNLTLGTGSSAQLGTYLIAYNGMTLYTYAKDSQDKSTCTGGCATTWPPYTIPAGTPVHLQAGVVGKAGMIARADGSMQVTYNGRPLYFYAGDTNGGDTNGQGIGGVWYVAKP